MNRKRAVFAAAVLGFAGAGEAALSDRTAATRGPMILREAGGARSLALGGATAALGDDVGALFINPAALQGLRRPEALFLHAESFGGGRREFAGAALPQWRNGVRRTVGFGAGFVAAPGIDIVEDERALGRARPQEWFAGASYARPFGTAHLGGTAKVVGQSLYADRSAGVAFDAGLWSSGDRGAWGATLANGGAPLSGVALPWVLRVGGVARLSRAGSRSVLRALGQADFPAEDRWRPRAGLEYETSRGRGWSAALRAGFEGRGLGETNRFSDQCTIGFGLRRGDVTVNYVFRPRLSLGTSHVLDVGWRFGAPLAMEERRDALIREAESHLASGPLWKARNEVNELMTIAPREERVERLARAVARRLEESLDPETLFTLGEDALTRGRYDEGADYLEKLLLLKPDHAAARALLDRARTRIVEDRRERMKKQIAEARRRDMTVRVGEAERGMARGRWDEAREAWTRVLELDPAHAAAKAGVRRCDEAIARNEEVLRATKARRGAEARTLYDEGVRLFQEGRHAEARERFQKSLELVPDDGVVRRALDRVTRELDRGASGGKP
jgi:tetratricopeptide (TPR) repeat protein